MKHLYFKSLQIGGEKKQTNKDRKNNKTKTIFKIIININIITKICEIKIDQDCK
jgi:hypothetical protein